VACGCLMATDRCNAFSLAGRRFSAPHIRVPVTGRGSSFTVIELIAVLAVLGVLMTLALGSAGAARQRAKIAAARAELAVFAQALEAYRAQYGDYPQTGAFPPKGPAVAAGDPLDTATAEAKLFNALLGKLGPRLHPVADATGAPVVGRAFVEAGRHSLEYADRLPAPVAEAANAFLDPWGQRYQYAYKNAAAPADWRAVAYVLFSAGPDGLAKPGDPPASGLVDPADPRNADNLYPGHE